MQDIVPVEPPMKRYPETLLPNGKKLTGPIQKIGAGSFASVSIYYLDGKKVAIKKFSKSYDGRDKQLQAHEIDMLKQVRNHPNIIQLIDNVIINNVCYIILELMHGSLEDFLYKKVNVSWETKLSLAIQMAQGIYFLHHLERKNNSKTMIVHQDLKPENLLVSRFVDDPSTRLKIGDFGLARKIELSGFFLGRVFSKKVSGRAGGTPDYMAPEAYNNNTDSCEPKSDIYSAGLILCQMATQLPVTREIDEISSGRYRLFEMDKAKAAAQKNNLAYPKYGYFGPVIKNCLVQKPSLRYNSSQFLKRLKSISNGK